MPENGFIIIKGERFPALVAVDHNDKQRGLMWEPWPPPIMAFPYRASSYNKFWMKNTISPLDIVFCCKNRVVGIFQGEPLSTKLIGPDKTSDLVVELPRGKAAELNLSVGDFVKLEITSE